MKRVEEKLKSKRGKQESQNWKISTKVKRNWT